MNDCFDKTEAACVPVQAVRHEDYPVFSEALLSTNYAL